MRKSCECYPSNYWRHITKKGKDTEKREREIEGKRLVKNTLKWSYIACVMPIASGVPLNYANNICLMVLPLASVVLK